ncbi:hypothetical protein sr07938 [Sporisorium reilianum SRZ2]|uniref:Uncharacterized protein n=1 Tax=Sporisorium reilianum (strain SRZ2) TaxID=999809 RepID=E6ZWP3_SPORE|nr:hypothetical protein sr07938 [Sporisorium reilianum SRZ2]
MAGWKGGEPRSTPLQDDGRHGSGRDGLPEPSQTSLGCESCDLLCLRLAPARDAAERAMPLFLSLPIPCSSTATSRQTHPMFVHLFADRLAGPLGSSLAAKQPPQQATAFLAVIKMRATTNIEQKPDPCLAYAKPTFGVQ